MDGSLARRETARFGLGANGRQQYGESAVQAVGATRAGPDRPSAATSTRTERSSAATGTRTERPSGAVMRTERPSGAVTRTERPSASGVRTERRNSVTQVVHQRHMPKEPQKFHIPRKTKEKRALLQYVSLESRECEDMMTILTSSYMDAGSASCFSYSKPRLVHSELLEKEFVEKRRAMKAEGRTDKELEDSYCFLLADPVQLLQLCEKGLFVGHSRLTALGNPSKGVSLSRYSDLLQMNAFTSGATGEIIIFKVLKGRVKSIYENMKNLLDPTPRFDSHIAKNASKVTALTSYRAFELTQQYFYEYSFDELLQRPRQACPYAVVSFVFSGKDAPLPIKPLAPLRLNSQAAEDAKERTLFTVWTGDLVKDDRLLFQISLCSSSLPVLPHRLPEKLEIGWLMKLEQVTKLLPPGLFSWNIYSSSREVATKGFYCSLLEVIVRSQSATKVTVTKLLQELEVKRVVLVNPLGDRGFLFLLSSVQMATPAERGEGWKRCLQALFVFTETRDVVKNASPSTSSTHDAPEALPFAGTVTPMLKCFIPALHYALVKARASSPPELSAGVEQQAREYLSGLSDGKVRQYPIGEYDATLDEQRKVFPAPRHHRSNMDSYLNSYLFSPPSYVLPVARARHAMETHSQPEEPQGREGGSLEGQKEAKGKDVLKNSGKKQLIDQKELLDMALSLKRDSEDEVKSEHEGKGQKRQMEQETSKRTQKYLRVSRDPRTRDRVPVETIADSAYTGSLASVIGSVGLRADELCENGSELANSLIHLLTGFSQAAAPSKSLKEEEVKTESSPFDKLAVKLGLPNDCDVELRKQEELEEQTAGSVSSLEGFSPSSHSGETNHRGPGRAGGALVRREEEEQWDIPWVLIPITGLRSERYTLRDQNLPEDPRFLHLTMATDATAIATSPRRSPTPSLQPSSPPSPSQCPSPEPSPPTSPSRFLSPQPSPPPSPSQCPSPEPSPPSPSQCPSPEPSPPPSPSQCPSAQPSPPTSSSQRLSPQPNPPPSPSQCLSPEQNALSPFSKDCGGTNEDQLVSTAPQEITGESHSREEEEQKNQPPSVFASVPPVAPPAESKEQDSGDEEPELAKGTEARFLQEECGSEERLQNEEGEAAPGTEGVHETVGHGEKEEDVFPAALTSPPGPPVRNIDTVVDKHLGDFCSEVQHLLQEESVLYSFPQTPAAAPPLNIITPFSQYVSFYNPCPPVQDYISSLKDNMNHMLMEMDNSWPGLGPDVHPPDTDATLACTVSEFVASIRAANTKTDTDDQVSVTSGEFTALSTAESVAQTLDISKREEMWLSDSRTNQFSEAPSSHSPSVPLPHVTLTASPSISQSSFHSKTISHTAIVHPLPSCGAASESLQSHLVLQQPKDLELNRSTAQNITQDDIAAKALHSATGGDSRVIFPETSCEGPHTGLVGVTHHSVDSSRPTDTSCILANPVSCSVSVSAQRLSSDPVPPVSAFSSLISQLQPDVFSSLEEIMKDVKRNLLQFYLHTTEPWDQVYEDIKAYLLKQGNLETQNPLTFLNQERSNSRLLVIIKNKDISGHIHEIPGLVSLKQHPSVVFVGVDSLDDFRNNSYDELFVSGGCIVSDELVLSPDFITHDQLASLLKLLEQHSSPEIVWRWKVHCRTHKKLKEQSRFRIDAANLLDVLSAYQKRMIVEFLPYHQCDMMECQSPDLDCLTKLQAGNTQYRHTVFLTEHRLDSFQVYSSKGIIVTHVQEILHSFSSLVGFHDIKDRPPIPDDLLALKGFSKQPSHCDATFPSEPAPTLPDLSLSRPSSDQQCLQQPGVGHTQLPQFSDPLVKEGGTCPEEVVQHHSESELEALRQYISDFRAKRQAQQQAELSLNHQKLFNSLACAGDPTDQSHLLNSSSAPSECQGGRTDTVHQQMTPGRKAVCATLDLIHSALLPDQGEDRGSPRRQHDSVVVRDHVVPSEQVSPSAPLCELNPLPASVPAGQTGSTSVTGLRSEEAEVRGEYARSCVTAEGQRVRDAHTGLDQPTGAEAIPEDCKKPNSNTSVSSQGKVSGSIPMETKQDNNLNRALQHHTQIHLQQAALQLQPPYCSRPLNPLQHFLPSAMLRPFNTLSGGQGLLGSPPGCPGSLRSTAGSVPVWNFLQASRELNNAALLGAYRNPAGQRSHMYRGGPRGGFNGM
ncbi:uncharacterized protein tasora [Thalassophryne amazonica]|uniref:uncharacterized protein tasora n=1 Tax=Thalassophryne amazonica TaxID=390379 RepID=UPI0014716AB0|nr:uncharacterized protein tasora [Thalassophryne amazonica]